MASEQELVIFGAGGHGMVISEMAVDAGWSVLGFLDDAAAMQGRYVSSFSILGDRDWLRQQVGSTPGVALGIGDNHARKILAEYLLTGHISVAGVISRSAIVSPTASIGPGVVIMPGAIINARAIIGTGAIINTGAVIEHDCRVGDFSHISPNATLGGAACVGELAHVGLSASVLPRITIGKGSILGAGSVATRDIPPSVIAAGVPARVTRPAHMPHKTPIEIDHN